MAMPMNKMCYLKGFPTYVQTICHPINNVNIPQFVSLISVDHCGRRTERQPKCHEEAQCSVSMQSRIPKVVKVSSNLPTLLFGVIISAECLLGNFISTKAQLVQVSHTSRTLAG